MTLPLRRQDVVVRRDSETGEYASSGEARFLELVRLRTMRNKVLSAQAESELLNDAVSRLGVPLNRARGILLSETDSSRIELESDLDDMAVGMLTSMAAPKSKLSSKDFDLVVRFYSMRVRKTEADARLKVKRLMEENAIAPKPRGLFRSLRWYRRIK